MKTPAPRKASKAKVARRLGSAKKSVNLATGSGPAKRERPAPLRASDFKDRHLELLNAAFE